MVDKEETVLVSSAIVAVVIKEKPYSNGVEEPSHEGNEGHGSDLY